MAKLDRDTVTRVALGVVDAQGVEQLTLRRVAAELGVTPMALYRHVESKDDLLDAVADLLYAELTLPRGGDWWHRLAGLARSTRKVALAHGSAHTLFLRPAAGPHARGVATELAAILEQAGIPQSEIAELHAQLTAVLFALTASSPSNAAFERGIALVRAGLEARVSVRYEGTPSSLRRRPAT
jgi:AcrR family transcriptional regulator